MTGGITQVGPMFLFYSSPTTQQTPINISGRNEIAEGEPRREGLPADLPHRSWKKDLPDGGKSTGGGGLACAGNNQERSVAGTEEDSADQTERPPCKEPELGSSVRCCAPRAWGGFMSRCAATQSGLACESLHFWRAGAGPSSSLMPPRRG